MSVARQREFIDPALDGLSAWMKTDRIASRCSTSDEEQGRTDSPCDRTIHPSVDLLWAVVLWAEPS
jgi:hypothetical protein